ncbi:zinc-dependent metalloprotease [Thalassotalea litorea]|uniref:zinc-dependent metalloprotease n=1 Tax=Thalassotalea litorea TaxID=2020715 RepID=UPI003735C788
MRIYKFLIFLVLAFSLQVNAQSIPEFAKNKQFFDGFIPFYLDENSGNVYLQIEDFDEPFLFQSSLPHGIGSNDIGLDRGQLGDTRLVQFEKRGNKVLLRQINTYYRADSDNAMERQAVNEAFASSIIQGFSIVESDKNRVIIDYTDFLMSDIHNLANTLKQREQGSFAIDKSRSAVYQERTKAFVDNTELEAIITFKGQGTGAYLKSVTPDANAVSVNLHHSMIRLPDNQYQTRTFHPFSGMWSVEYADYASAIEDNLVKRIIPRHRLQKKNPTAQRSEAVEPIVYYLDPGVPEPVKSALIDGALWWNEAYEELGFIDAFQVKMLPEDADPMDVRYNVIQWVHRATRGWSYGASVIDPRTGEILKGHVTLGSLRVRQDYLIALGLTSPFTGKQKVDTTAMKNMALARIRQLSAHEVGHTLGVAHNFSASVNNRASVMDYPHPYVKLDENGNIDLSQAYDVGLGAWDKHVIAYAYGIYQNETESLAKVIRSAKEKGLKYMSDPDARPRSGADAHGHLWDNGADPVEELARVNKIRSKALENFGADTIPAGIPFSELENTLVPIYNFHRYQVEAAVKLIAGLDYQYAIKGEDNSPVKLVAPNKQQQAIHALLLTLDSKFLTLPESILALIPPKAYGYYRDRESFPSKTGLAFDPVSAAQASAKHTISLMLEPQRLARLQQHHARNNAIPGVVDLLNQLTTKTIKSGPASGMELVVQQRVNQQTLDNLLSLYHNPELVGEVRADVYQHLSDLQEWLTINANRVGNNKLASQYHLLAGQIAYSLQQGKVIMPEANVKLPPGSPIGNN